MANPMVIPELQSDILDCVYQIISHIFLLIAACVGPLHGRLVLLTLPHSIFCVGTFKEFSVWNAICVRGGSRCSDSCSCRSITTLIWSISTYERCVIVFHALKQESTRLNNVCKKWHQNHFKWSPHSQCLSAKGANGLNLVQYQSYCWDRLVESTAFQIL